jgi:hypothetical protein
MDQYFYGYCRFNSPNKPGVTMQFEVKAASEDKPFYLIVAGRSSAEDTRCDIGMWAEVASYEAVTSLPGLPCLQFCATGDALDLYFRRICVPGPVILTNNRDQRDSGDQRDYVMGMVLLCPTLECIAHVP